MAAAAALLLSSASAARLVSSSSPSPRVAALGTLGLSSRAGAGAGRDGTCRGISRPSVPPRGSATRLYGSTPRKSYRRRKSESEKAEEVPATSGDLDWEKFDYSVR